MREPRDESIGKNKRPTALRFGTLGGQAARGQLAIWNRAQDAGFRNRRCCGVVRGAAAEFREDEEVEEVHHAKNDEHKTDFAAKDLDGSLGVRGLIAVFQSERDESYVNEIKTDH